MKATMVDKAVAVDKAVVADKAVKVTIMVTAIARTTAAMIPWIYPRMSTLNQQVPA